MKPENQTQTGRTTAGLENLLVDSLNERWRRYCRNLKSCQKHFSEEAVHDLRVATRRLMSLADLLAHVVPDHRLRKARRALKKRLDLFDPLRDTQVLLLSVETMLPAFPELQEFYDALAKRERRLIKQIGKKLRRLKTAKLEKTVVATRKQLRTLLSNLTIYDETFVTIMNAIDIAFANVVERRRHIDARHSATIHRTRVAFKKFRYMVEVLQPLLAEVTNERMKQMQAFQTMMGDIQDIEVFSASLETFRLQEHTEMDLFLYPVQQELARRRSELIDAFLKSVDELFTFWNHDHLRLTLGPISHKQVV